MAALSLMISEVEPMKFSKADVIGRERKITFIHEGDKEKNLFSYLFDWFLFPKNPVHTFTFQVPSYLHERSVTFCYDISEEIGEDFTPSRLANALFLDFLEFVKKSNDMHEIYNRLNARSLSPTTIQPYETEAAYPGVVFEEIRGYKKVQTTIKHIFALKGEQHLYDMLAVYPNHTFTLEHVLEFIFCDFIDDYRKKEIKNPIKKILQYL
jgi:hypothetical protein